MAGKDYDVAAAFQAIEYELINSFFRNMKKHKVDEVKEQKEWAMWQVRQLQELDLYKKRNAKKYGTKFTDINKTIAEMLRLSNEAGQMEQEAEILSAMKDGLKPERASETLTARFFRTNDRKLDTLINATVSDMEKAEVAVLRKAEDIYRKTIFNAAVYANTGAGTYEKAVDMATKDFMAAGLTCVEYKNGAMHTISDYADMAVRTANKRAYLQGEGTKRQEWGIHTVIVNKRLRACPHCMPFAGKVFIDDVWGGGTAADGDYPLLSEAVAAGLYHPRCKDSHTAYFPGVSDKPKKYTKEEVKEAEKAEEQERKADYAERQAEKYQRVADTRLDPENRRGERQRAKIWAQKAEEIKKKTDAGDGAVENSIRHARVILREEAINERFGIIDEIRGHRDDTPQRMVDLVNTYSRDNFVKIDPDLEYTMAYDEVEDLVLINPNKEGFGNLDFHQAMIHEIAHRIDFNEIECTVNAHFIKSVAKCKKRLLENASLYRRLIEGKDNEWYYNPIISDLFSVITNNEIAGVAYHKSVDIDRLGFAEREIFANLFTALYQGDDDTITFIKEELSEIFDGFSLLLGV